MKLAAAAAVLLAGVVFMLRGLNVRGLIEQGAALINLGIAMISDAGLAVFFAAMTLLPAAGVPVLAFALTIGPAFGERLGMGTVVLLSLLAVTLNLVIAYALARRALRPLLERLMARLGYKLPQVEAGDAADLVIILRMTPGIPYFVQNYLLGLAEVPFGKYFIMSCLISWPYNAAFVLFGDALRHGKGGMALFAVSLLAALAAATHLVRRHYNRKKAGA